MYDRSAWQPLIPHLRGRVGLDCVRVCPRWDDTHRCQTGPERFIPRIPWIGHPGFFGHLLFIYSSFLLLSFICYNLSLCFWFSFLFISFLQVNMHTNFSTMLNQTNGTISSLPFFLPCFGQVFLMATVDTNNFSPLVKQSLEGKKAADHKFRNFIGFYKFLKMESSYHICLVLQVSYNTKFES